jgi:hypothetical protein
VIANRQGDPLSITFGSTLTVNPGGADDDKTSDNGAGIFSVATTGATVAEAMGEAAALADEAVIFAGEAVACAIAAGCVAAGAALSREHAASIDAAVNMIVMIFGLFIRDPFYSLLQT